MTSKTKTLTDPDGDKLSIEAYPGGLVIATGRSAASRAVRDIDPAELIDAIREVAGMDETPKPAPAREHTAEDFVRARFAVHPDGGWAGRVDPNDYRPWAACVDGGTADYDDEQMAEEGWQIVTPAPSTPREAVALAVSLAYEPEGDTMPDQDGYMMVARDGRISVLPDASPCDLPARDTTCRRLLLDPPATVTPEWHSARIVEARVLDRPRCQWASTTDGRWVALNGSNFSVHRDNLADVKVVVPGKVEA